MRRTTELMPSLDSYLCDVEQEHGHMRRASAQMRAYRALTDDDLLTTQ